MTAADWRRYEPFLLSGLWHVHTDLTDGVHDVRTLVEFAADRGFPLVGIVEHVRRELTYDFDRLYETATDAAVEAGVRPAVGCEAKVLDTDGRLDVDEATRERADLVYAAYHGTPFDRGAYVESVHATLSNPAVDVWAHPLTYPARGDFELDSEVVDELLGVAADNDVLFELNMRRPVEGVRSRPAFERVRPIVGYDLHDLSRWGSR